MHLYREVVCQWLHFGTNSPTGESDDSILPNQERIFKSSEAKFRSGTDTVQFSTRTSTNMCDEDEPKAKRKPQKMRETSCTVLGQRQ